MNYKKSLKNPIFQTISKVADELNYPTYVVGGWVRDLLLEREKEITDIDFVCIGSGVKLAEKVSEILGKKAILKVFKKFGTALITFNEENYEFIGARKESYRRDSRKPIIENGTLEDDQNRRDFTINAMALQLNKEHYGEFLDPFNGRKDLENKIIITPLNPHKTFSDDPLRMMRAIRFAAQLNFSIDPDTIEAIKMNAHRLEIISQERITQELNKIILTITPSIGFKLLYDTNLLKQFFN